MISGLTFVVAFFDLKFNFFIYFFFIAATATNVATIAKLLTARPNCRRRFFTNSHNSAREQSVRRISSPFSAQPPHPRRRHSLTPSLPQKGSLLAFRGILLICKIFIAFDWVAISRTRKVFCPGRDRGARDSGIRGFGRRERDGRAPIDCERETNS